MNTIFKLILFILVTLTLQANSIESSKSKVLKVIVETIIGSNSYGSTVIISNQGDFVTAYHVIDNAKNVTLVDSSGKKYKATIGKVSVKDDLAYLHIDNFNIDSVNIDSNISWGEEVYSIGGDGTLLKGVIAKDDVSSIVISYSVPYGNSGGGVFNAKGNLIAIISKSSINEGITYATKVNRFKNITQTFEHKETINLKSNNYDYSYCTTQKTIQTWKNLTKADDIKMHTLHAIFLGLCEKVKRKDMTTEEADYIYLENRQRLFDF